MKRIFTRMLVLLLAIATIAPDAAAVNIVRPVATPAEPDPARVQSALNEFHSLPAKEQKQRVREAKKALKEFKEQKKAGKEPMMSTGLQVLFAILLPPLGVYFHEGEINSKFWICLLLTIIFYIPGLIYALVVILGDK